MCLTLDVTFPKLVGTQLTNWILSRLHRFSPAGCIPNFSSLTWKFCFIRLKMQCVSCKVAMSERTSTLNSKLNFIRDFLEFGYGPQILWKTRLTWLYCRIWFEKVNSLNMFWLSKLFMPGLEYFVISFQFCDKTVECITTFQLHICVRAALSLDVPWSKTPFTVKAREGNGHTVFLG